MRTSGLINYPAKYFPAAVSSLLFLPNVSRSVTVIAVYFQCYISKLPSGLQQLLYCKSGPEALSMFVNLLTVMRDAVVHDLSIFDNSFS